MSDRTAPKIPKWPFLLGDALLIVAAVWIALVARNDSNYLTNSAAVACVALGACLCVLPFIMEYRAAAAFSALDTIHDAIAKIQGVETVAGQIAGATAQWQGVQEHSVKTNESARQIADQFTTESRAFAEFLKTANDSEKSHLRLEVEKLRRAEGDWLQIVVRILDHIYALQSAAVKSGQPNLISQLTNFQNACRDVARRPGLTAFVAEPGVPFDAQAYDNAEGDAVLPANARIVETVATGLTFQGQLIRKPIVICRVPTNEPQAVQAGSET